MLQNVLVYCTVLSIVLFVLMGVDKYRAKHFKWRIRERTLFLLAVLGGALGGCLGMVFFRHKTRTKSFVWMFPMLLLAQIAVIVLSDYWGLFKN